MTEQGLNQDNYFMEQALAEAYKALAIDEVPIGAVVVKDGQVIGSGYNQRETLKDPTAHAEILALRSAAKALGGWRLTGCQLYVTIEPCAMCTGAIIQSRIKHLIFGASDPKAGACGSAVNLLAMDYHNHGVESTSGVCESDCSAIMKTFFKALRTK